MPGGDRRSNGPVAASGRHRRFGADRVVEGEDSVVIDSGVDMAGWEVRKHRKPIVHYAGRTWTILRKRRGERGTYRYELIPWVPADLDEPGVDLHYSEEFVAERDRDRVVQRRREAESVALSVASPLIGFLGARTRRRLEASYGVDPVRAVFASILLEVFAMLVCLVLVSIGAMVQIFGTPSPWRIGRLAAIALVLAVDAWVRYGRLLDEQRYAPGFYEWLWRRRDR